MHDQNLLAGLRVALYARFSTEKQNPSSVDDQHRRCREHVLAMGGIVSDRLVFSDHAESGASLVRSGGIERLLAEVRARRVDCIVVEDISRLTRNLAEGATLFDELEFLRVRVVTVADGIDTKEKGANLQVSIRLLLSSQMLRDVADKTRRGLTARALAGLSTGLLPFGYHSKAGAVGYEIFVDADDARVVRRIFDEFVEGRSYASIAKRLNAEDILPPRGNGKRTRAGWVANGIREILLNTKYAGIWKFNEREWLKKPGTKLRVSRLKAQSEVLVQERMHLRIVEAEVWARAAERFASNRARYGADRTSASRSSFGRAGKPTPYLLSGLLICGRCEAPMSISGGEVNRRYYHCARYLKRGNCTNGLSVRENVARKRIVAGVFEAIASPEALIYVRRQIAMRLSELAIASKADTKLLSAKLLKIETRIRNLTNALAEGDSPQSILHAIRAEESGAKLLRAEVAEAKAASDAPTWLPTQEDVQKVVLDFEKCLARDPEASREAIRSLLLGGTIKLTPGDDGVYRAEADILLGALLLRRPGIPQTTTPADEEPDGRYTTSGCGGWI